MIPTSCHEHLDGKSALVTGGGRGMGPAHCPLLARAGAGSEDVARRVLFIVSDDSAMISGQTITPSGGQVIDGISAAKS